MEANKKNSETLSKQSDTERQTSAIEYALKSATSKYYSAEKILILKAGGNPGRIHVNCELGGAKMSFCFLTKHVELSSPWERNMCTDAKAAWDDKTNDVIVTPGLKGGYNIIHFWNNKSDDVFDVLVIVE